MVTQVRAITLDTSHTTMQSIMHLWGSGIKLRDSARLQEGAIELRYGRRWETHSEREREREQHTWLLRWGRESPCA